MPRSVAEEKFIHEYTRELLVTWASQCILTGAIQTPNPPEFLAHAVEKGWVSKDGCRVLAAGYTAAAGQLKR
jgi:hypothetical protein